MIPPPAAPAAHHQHGHVSPRGIIRQRILIGSLGLLGLSLFLSFAVGSHALHARLDRQVDRELTGELAEFRHLVEVGVDPASGAPLDGRFDVAIRKFLDRHVPGEDCAYFSLLDGERFEASPDAPLDVLDQSDLERRWASATEPGLESAVTAAGEVRYAVAPLYDGDTRTATFVVAHFMRRDRAELDAALGLQAGIGVAVFVVASLVAASLARRIVRPIDELARTARTITDTDLSARIAVRGNDELSTLGRTINEMLARLETGFSGQRRFLDDVAHELRTPLTIVQGHLDLMGDDPHERARTTDLIQDELQRMQRYVDDLLLLAKAETRDFLRLRPVDVGELAASVHRHVTALADRDWRLEAAPRLGEVTITADAARLTQAVLNLASNAVDHTGPRDEIGLGFVLLEERPVGRERTDDEAELRLRISVSDRGSGIDPEVIGHLFDRSRRGAASRTRRADGLGIGLSIVDAVVRAHRGRVWADNRPGGGARFVIELPVGPDPGTPPPGTDSQGATQTIDLRPAGSTVGRGTSETTRIDPVAAPATGARRS
jgi:signal transduction histidine kinase